MRSTSAVRDRAGDDPARRRAHDRPADLHRRAAYRRLRRSDGARARRASSTSCWPPDHGADRLVPVAHRASIPPPMPRALVAAIGEAAAGGAADAVHAGDVGPARPRCGARRGQAADRRGGRRARGVPRGGASATASGLHLGSLAVRDRGRQARQPRLPDRPGGRDPRALRQDPSVRRRSADRRELARIRGLSARASERWWSTARRSDGSA